MQKFKNIIILNGPPRSGKDTIAKLIPTLTKEIVYQHEKFSDPLKAAVHALWEIPKEIVNRYEELKDIPLSELRGKTLRRCYIDMAEKLAKKEYGNTFFGQSLCRKLKPREADVAIISDGGFAEEIIPLYSLVKVPSDICLVRLYRDGYSFEMDSRDYIQPEDFLWNFDLKSEGFPYIFDVTNKEGDPESAAGYIAAKCLLF